MSTVRAHVAAESKLIVNLTRGNVVCEQGVIADRPLRRMRGLLGRRSLSRGDGLLLRPAPSIHTALMLFPIDVVFLDGTLQVLKTVERLPAWRIASAYRARAALELTAGECARRGVAVGDQFALIDIAERTGTVEPNGSADAPRVLLVASDRRFRAVTAALLTRRGCTVTVGERMATVAELAEQDAADVVVLDAGQLLTAAARVVAQIEALNPRPGVVIVGEEPEGALSAMPVLPKWGSFEELYSAIEHARPNRGSWRPPNGNL
jgi:uncharacterized membrane protein (UPF0127 family)/CheY-like chemotaxis protein